ncbi:CU044_5270 family protein [Streptomyces sp. NPDC002994]|uniref:CU044_5270 family protein n=1 Tax=Streptomyces sp. NPDC002994 TaxID=3154441 RepID=UPI00339F5819
MDEMTQLRAMRADAPTPDRAALAPGRQRLTEALAGGRRSRRLRADWRIASVGAAAAITAAALLGTQLVGASAPDPAGPAASGVLSLGSPAEVLNRAADHLERQQAAPEPRADQWIYTRTVLGKQAGGKDFGGFATGEVTYEPDSWLPYDNPAAEDGKDDDEYSAREIYRAAAALPDDPARLLEKVRAFYPTGTGKNGPPEDEARHSFRALGAVIESYPLPPDALARLYRAMATVPGVQVTDHLVRDAAGREAIAITRDEGGESHMRREFLIDPRGYGYLGMRDVAAEDYTYTLQMPDGVTMGDGKKDPSQKFKAGDILYSVARTKAAVVDAEGLTS